MSEGRPKTPSITSWAVGAFAALGTAWDGLAKRLLPGTLWLTPKTLTGPRQINYVLGDLVDAANGLVDWIGQAPALNWLFKTSNANKLRHGAYGEKDQVWIAVGGDVVDSVEVSYDFGRTWANLAGSIGLTSSKTCADVAIATNGDVLIMTASTDLYHGTWSAYGTLSFAAVTSALAHTPASGGMAYDPTAGVWLVCYRNGTAGYVDTTPDGTAWTSRTLPAAWASMAAKDPEIHAVAGRAVAAFIDAATPRLNVMYSTDGGATWTNVQIATHASSANLASCYVTRPTYDGVRDAWYVGVVAVTGVSTELFRSLDGGATWASVQTATAEAGAGGYLLPFVAGDIQALGDLLVTTDGSGRMAYSVNQGAVWCYSGRNAGTTTRLHIRTGGGGFMLWNDTDKITFASLRLGAPGMLV